MQQTDDYCPNAILMLYLVICILQFIFKTVLKCKVMEKHKFKRRTRQFSYGLFVAGFHIVMFIFNCVYNLIICVGMLVFL